MFKMKFFRTMAILTILAVLPFVGCKKHEHPAEENDEKAAVTNDQLADAIEAYVKQESAGQGGYFMVMDDKSGQQLKLSLDKVHRERLSKVGKNTYFACADFTTPDGKVYDLDVFMTGQDKDSLVFSDFSVHKEAGKERYTWYEEGGIWKKQPVGGDAEHPEKTEDEHPEKTEDEHPKKTEDEHPKKTEDEHPKKTEDEHPKKTEDEHPEKTEDEHPEKTEDEHPEKTEDEHPEKTEDEHPKKTEDEHPEKTEDEHPKAEHPE